MLAARAGAAQDALAGSWPATAAAAARRCCCPPGVADAALATNAAVRDSPTTPALRRYAGVVYDGLDYAAADPAEQRVAAPRAC